MQKFKKAQSASPLVVFDVKQQGRFTLRHFIEDVPYNVHNFLEKNKDTTSQDVEQLLSTSSVPLVKHLFSVNNASDSPTIRRSPSVTSNRSPGSRKVPHLIHSCRYLIRLGLCVSRIQKPTRSSGDSTDDISMSFCAMHQA